MIRDVLVERDCKREVVKTRLQEIKAMNVDDALLAKVLNVDKAQVIAWANGNGASVGSTGAHLKQIHAALVDIPAEQQEIFSQLFFFASSLAK